MIENTIVGGGLHFILNNFVKEEIVFREFKEFKQYRISEDFGALGSRLTPELLEAIEFVERELFGDALGDESPMETEERRKNTISVRRDEFWNFRLDVHVESQCTLFERILVTAGTVTIVGKEEEKVLH